jgi:hypothetical protein
VRHQLGSKQIVIGGVSPPLSHYNLGAVCKESISIGPKSCPANVTIGTDPEQPVFMRLGGVVLV